MVIEYLNNLKSKNNYSWADIAKLSNLPESTVRKIFSGETADPRFDTIRRLVEGMGGSLDEIRGKTLNNVPAEMYMLTSLYEQRIADQKTIIKNMAIALWIVGGVLLGTIVADLIFGGVGWIRW